MRIGVLRAILSVLLLAMAACGMNKPTSLSHIAYHDLTARYNRYFNAKLLLQQTDQFLAESHQDNYEELLPLYIETTEESAQSVYGDMDEVLKKASANIKLHENSKWTDDAYYHIGMAHYHKRDFHEALKAFVFVTSEFEDGLRLKERKSKGRNKRKKRTRAQAEKERNTNEYYDETLSFTKHKPARYESIIMIIRTYTHLREWDKAQSIISLAKGDRKFPDDLKEDLAVATTAYHIARSDYNNAIGSLTEAILLAKKNDDKRRYTFILAQLHRRANLNTMAIQYFNEVLDMKPDFEMEFQAKIKIAKISKEENLYSNQEVLALLKEMLRNDKYRMFKGEIYFTLAEIYLKEGSMDKAVESFLASVEHSRDNPEQQALAFLQLAELYFVKEEYRTSQVYHDSTLTVLPTAHTAYEDVVDRNDLLKNLVRNLDIIETEDSLQYLASLSEEELNAFIAEKEKKAREKAQAEAEAAGQPAGDDGFSPLMSNNSNQSASSWPFDDPNLKGRGYNAFKQRWGDRPRVDYWRISAKANNLLAREEDEEEDGAATDTADTQEEFQLGELPKTPEAMEASNKRIMDAYFNLGNLYRDRLENEVQAIAAFETLMARFPDNPYRLETAYTLYLIYKDSKPDKAQKYKSIIISEFPESIIAKVLQNPNYIQETKEKENELQDYYATTYEFFSQDDLMTALERKKRAEQLYPNNPLQPKFDMLEALIYGKMGKYDTCKMTLQTIVNKYPNDEVQPQAVTMLNLLEGRGYETNAGNIAANTYTMEPESAHFMCVLVRDPELDVTALQTRIAQFNDEFFRLASVSITPVILNNDLQMILLKSFDNADKAKKYYNSIRYNKSVFSGWAEEDYDVFYISKRNYGVFFRQKDIVNYMTFFTQRYLRE